MPNMLDYWLEALSAPDAGIAIKTHPEDRKIVTNQLYAARGEAEDTRLEELVVSVPQEPKDEVWVVKREKSKANKRKPANV